MKKIIVGILGFVIIATIVYAQSKTNVPVIPLPYQQGTFVKDHIVRMTMQPLTESNATFYTAKINTAHMKTIQGYFSLDAVFRADTAATVANDTFWVTLLTSHQFGSAALTKVLAADTFVAAGKRLYNLGQGLDTLLWEDTYLRFDIRDTILGAAEDTVDYAAGKTIDYWITWGLEPK